MPNGISILFVFAYFISIIHRIRCVITAPYKNISDSDSNSDSDSLPDSIPILMTKYLCIHGIDLFSI